MVPGRPVGNVIKHPLYNLLYLASLYWIQYDDSVQSDISIPWCTMFDDIWPNQTPILGQRRGGGGSMHQPRHIIRQTSWKSSFPSQSRIILAPQQPKHPRPASFRVIISPLFTTLFPLCLPYIPHLPLIAVYLYLIYRSRSLLIVRSMRLLIWPLKIILSRSSWQIHSILQRLLTSSPSQSASPICLNQEAKDKRRWWRLFSKATILLMLWPAQAVAFFRWSWRRLAP